MHVSDVAARKPAPAPAELPPSLITLDDVLVLYDFKGCTKFTLRNLIKAGKLPASKIGKRLFVSRADVVELFMPRARVQQGGEEPVARVPNTGGLSPCPTCSAMSTREHQEICAS